jgi:quercetin dioxygenase-like cupin family protein
LLLSTVLIAWATIAQAQTPPVVVKEIFSGTTTAVGQPIVLPREKVQVTVSTYEIAPGARLAVHQHPSARYAYVLAGTLQVTEADSGASKTYSAGDFIIEMIGLWHYGTNVGDVPVRLLVIDQTEAGSPSTILQPK